MATTSYVMMTLQPYALLDADLHGFRSSGQHTTLSLHAILTLSRTPLRQHSAITQPAKSFAGTATAVSLPQLLLAILASTPRPSPHLATPELPPLLVHLHVAMMLFLAHRSSMENLASRSISGAFPPPGCSGYLGIVCTVWFSTLSR